MGSAWCGPDKQDEATSPFPSSSSTRSPSTRLPSPSPPPRLPTPSPQPRLPSTRLPSPSPPPRLPSTRLPSPSPPPRSPSTRPPSPPPRLPSHRSLLPPPSPPPRLSLHKSPSHVIEPVSKESTSLRRESEAMVRISKVRISRIDPLELIKGYENVRLVTLEEALKAFHGQIHDLSDRINEAKAKCNRSSKYRLTHDESAAIYIYSMKWEPQCVYDHLHAAWNSRNRSHLIPWFKYLRLFKSALDKLPNAKTEIWQGIAYDQNIKEKLTSNTLYSFLGSCSTSEHEIKNYLHNNVSTRIILIGYESVDGKLVTGYTAGDWSEVILWPGVKVAIAKPREIYGNGSVTYHLGRKPGK